MGLSEGVYRDLLNTAHLNGWNPEGTKLNIVRDWVDGPWHGGFEPDTETFSGSYFSNDGQTISESDCSGIAAGLVKANRPENQEAVKIFTNGPIIIM